MSVLYESTDNDSDEDDDNVFDRSMAYAVGWEEEVAELARPLIKPYDGESFVRGDA